MNKFYKSIINLDYKFKISLMFFMDINLLLISIFSAYFLKYNNFNYTNIDNLVIIKNLILFVPVSLFSGFYSNYTRYLNFDIIVQLIFKLLLFSFILFFFSLVVFNQPEYSQKLIFIQLIIFINLIILSRISLYFLLGLFNKKDLSYNFYYLGYKDNFDNSSLNFFSNNKSFKGFFIDIKNDNRKILNKKMFSYLNFKKVINIKSKSQLYFIYSQKDDSIKIKKYIQEKSNIASNKFITIPQLQDFISGKYQIRKYKEINFENLLSRDITFNKKEISKFVKNKCILITGAGGSIGTEIAYQIASYKPKNLIFFDHSEYNIYKLQELLQKKYKNINCKFLLGSISSFNDLNLLFENNHIDIVYHAAAYKHVPILQKDNLIKSIENNVFGTHILMQLLIKYNIKNFLFISTDKAVRSKNIMGLTKRLGELIVQSYAKKFKSNFNIVRFGNVVGSSGSAVNVFYDQIKNHENITLTHKNATRYFMTLREAVGLVLETSTFSAKGNIFLLDMGEPIKIIDIIKKMINLSGLSLKTKSNPNGDLSIKIIGLRPGEKIYEELLVDPSSYESINKFIYKADDPYMDYKKIQKLINIIKINIKNKDLKKLNKILSSFAYDDFSQHIKL